MHKILEHRQLLLDAFIIILVGCYLVAKYHLIQKVSTHSAKINSHPLRWFIRYCAEPIVLAITVVIVNFLLPSYVREQPGYIHTIDIIKIVIFTLFALSCISFFKEVITNRKKESLYNMNARRINTQINILIRVSKVVISIISASLILTTFPEVRKVGISILTSAGIMGIALGFAAQKSLGNIWTGIQIAFTQPIKIGDKVVIENEIGTIESIRLTYAVLRTVGNRKLIVPITYFNDKAFQNWTKNSLDLLALITMSVDYMVPVYKIEEEFERTLQETKLWDKKTKEFLVTNIKFDMIELRVIASAARVSDANELQYYIRRRLIDFIQKNRELGNPG